MTAFRLFSEKDLDRIRRRSLRDARLRRRARPGRGHPPRGAARRRHERSRAGGIASAAAARRGGHCGREGERRDRRAAGDPRRRRGKLRPDAPGHGTYAAAHARGLGAGAVRPRRVGRRPRALARRRHPRPGPPAGARHRGPLPGPRPHADRLRRARELLDGAAAELGG